MTAEVLTNARLITGRIGGIVEYGAVRVEAGRITHAGPVDRVPHEGAEVVDCHGRPVTPGYVDIHHHGAGGRSYDDGYAAAPEALAHHRAHGTAYSVLSFVTGSVDNVCARIADGARVVAEDPRVLGLHPEGPFLHPSHKGAHPEHLLRDPDPESVRRILEAADGTLAQLTLAPERDGGLAAVRRLAEAGVHVAVGHSSMDFEVARAAFDAGATILTHAFNGMEGIHHRAPGPVVAALDDERVWLEVICDRIHVHPSVVASLFAAAPERMVLVTDAMSAACSPDGHYRLGELDVVVADGVARLREGDSLAGSTLTMDRAVANAVRAAGVDLDVAVAAATHHPARAIGRSDEVGLLAPGYPADLLVLGEDLLPAEIRFRAHP